MVVNVTRKWKKRTGLHLVLLSFFSIYLGWVSCFYFCKITFSITGNAPLILKIFDNKTDIILVLMHKLLFFSYVLLFTISLLILLNYICHLKYLLLFYFVSKTVKGIKLSEKRLKLFEYLRNNINNNGFIFLQETHLSSKDEQKWKYDFRGPLFFSHRKSNSCGVAICYCGTEAFKVVNTVCDKNEPILILDAELNGTNVLLINFHNSVTESEQLSTFSTLQKLLEKVDDYNKKKHYFWR